MATRPSSASSNGRNGTSRAVARRAQLAATAATPAMLAAHLAAAAATVLLLRRGEHAAAALAGIMALAAPRRLSSWRPMPRGRLAAPVELLIQPFATLGIPLLSLRHRGPPLRHAF